jgi:hypothetical protein
MSARSDEGTLSLQSLDLSRIAQGYEKTEINSLSNASFFRMKSSCEASDTGMKQVYTQQRG